MDKDHDIKELEKLEDNDIQVKDKRKKDHKLNKDDNIYRAKLTFNNYSKACRSKTKDLKRGDMVIIPTQYGPEIGIIQGPVPDVGNILHEDEIVEIIRIATEKDIDKFEENEKRAEKAYSIAQKKISEHHLEMKLVNVHYFLEDSKILFNFTADGRIDFRELVKDLASIFKTRIELRQIGVRDECRILHGYGQCGRHFCCSDVNNDLAPITIKMAKEQNITLNSLKISGSCGRLLCCLAYEYDTYINEKRNLPVEYARIQVNNTWYQVTEVNIQTGMVKCSSEDHMTFFYLHHSKIKYNKDKKTGYVKEKIEI